MRFRRLSRCLRRPFLVAALLALGLAQTLGAMHAIVHAPRLAAFASASLTAEGSAPRTDWITGLFGGHGHADHACDLYDQLSHADLMPTVLPALPPAPLPEAIEVAHVAWHLASQAAGFLARGPPSRSS